MKKYNWKCPVCGNINNCTEDEKIDFDVHCNNCGNDTYTSEIDFKEIK